MTQQEPPALPPETSPPEASPLDVTWADVRVELDALQNKKRSVLSNITVLVVTLVLFAAMGVFSFEGINIVILIGVLFFHELGHFIGMKMFGYRDVRMFFIPMLGAAVSGQQSNPSSAKQAVVALLGPVPGIVLGVIFGVLHVLHPHVEVFTTLWMYLLFLNLFNLLPLHPLDGGRFLEWCLFSRSPKIEVVFRFVTGLCLLGVAILLKAPFLGIFSLFMLVSTSGVRLAASIAAELKKEIPPEECTPLDLPDWHLFTITERLNQKVSKQNRKAGYFAVLTRDIWERVCNRAPSVGETLALLFVYVGSIVFGVAGAVGIVFVRGLMEGRF